MGSLFLFYVEVVQLAYHQHDFIFTVYRVNISWVYMIGVLKLDMNTARSGYLR